MELTLYSLPLIFLQKHKIKELIKIIELLEKLVIQLISLFGWIAILALTIKGLLNNVNLYK